MRAAIVVILAFLFFPALVAADRARVRLIFSTSGYRGPDDTAIMTSVSGGELSIDVRHWVEGCVGRAPRPPVFDVEVEGERVRIMRRGTASTPSCEIESDAICSDTDGPTMPCPRATCACEYRILATVPLGAVRRVEVGDAAGIRARRAVRR